VEAHTDRPTLKAIVLDFSSVNNVDLTSVQNLIDVRNQFDRYASPEVVEWHFATINNRWTKRALAAAGFGYPAPTQPEAFQRWKPIFSVAEIGGDSSAAEAAEKEERRRQAAAGDVEHAPVGGGNGYPDKHARVAVVHGVNLPLFHVDLTSAVQAAIAHAERKSDVNVEN
jgi:solute carrier family 26 (sodium-independent sulfate anion transporter), member 11